ncbi:hypothetical protein [Halomicronema hongdechloris]
MFRFVNNCSVSINSTSEEVLGGSAEVQVRGDQNVSINSTSEEVLGWVADTCDENGENMGFPLIQLPKKFWERDQFLAEVASDSFH